MIFCSLFNAAQQPTPEKTEIDDHTPVIIGAVLGSVGGLVLLAIIVVIAIIIFMKTQKKEQYTIGSVQTGYHIENEYTSIPTS